MNQRWAELRAFYAGLEPRERFAVLGVGALIAVLFVWLLGVQPLLGLAEGARKRAAAAEEQLTQVQALRGRYDEVNGRLAAVEQRIQRAPRGNIFTTLENLARQSAVKVESMEPQTSPASDRYRETKVQVSLKGVTLAQMVNYLRRIEDAPQMLSIKSLRIKTRADKDLLDVSFAVSSFEPV